MVSFQVNLRVIRALAKWIAPKQEVRPYLNGVHVEFCTDGVYYVATDGKMLAALREPLHTDTPPVKEVAVGVPHVVAMKLAVAKKGEATAILTFEDDKFTLDGQVFQTLVGFPEWRRILPGDDLAKHGERIAQYDGGYFADLEGCLSEIMLGEAGFVTVRQNGERVAVVTCARVPEFLGVVMPRETNAEIALPPAWSRIKVEMKVKTPKTAAPEGADLV